MAAEKEKNRTEAQAPVQASSGKESSKVLFIGILVGVIILNSIIAFALIQLTKPKADRDQVNGVASESVEKSKSDDLKTLGAVSDPPIEAIVNIAGTDGLRFLKVVVRFEYDDKEYKNLGEELARRNPKLKDLLIDQLSGITLEELEKSDAKDEIRRDLRRIVNNTLPEDIGKVRDVFLNDFIIQ